MLTVRTTILTNGIELKHGILEGKADHCLGLLFEDWETREPKLQEEIWISAARHNSTRSYVYPLYDLNHLLPDLEEKPDY